VSTPIAPVKQSQLPHQDVKKSSSISSPRLTRVKRAESNKSNSSHEISPFSSRKPSTASSKFSDSQQTFPGIYFSNMIFFI